MAANVASAQSIKAFLESVAQRVREADVFGTIKVAGGMVACDAKNAAGPAQYRLVLEGDRCFVELTTPDRWLSHSIEADLLNTGDKLEELVNEELAELGAHELRSKVEHFRNAEKLFTFRSVLPFPMARIEDRANLECSVSALLAYEAAFRMLGDMEAKED